MEDEIHDPATVAALFDRLGPRDRRWTLAATLGLAPALRRRVVTRLSGVRQIGRIEAGRIHPAPAAPPHIVDLMAGDGALWPPLLGAFPGARITAIDIAPGMRDRARDRLARLPGARIDLRTADALLAPLADGSADLVVSAFGLKALDARRQAALAAEIARLLRPGGGFALVEVSGPQGALSGPLFRGWLGRALPALARLIGGDGPGRESALLARQVAAFGTCDGIAAALRDAGLMAGTMRHAGGIATSVAGIRPIAPGPGPA